MEISAHLAQLEAQLPLLAEHWNQFSEAELRAYPGDLLSSPLAVGSVQVAVAPGTGSTFGIAFPLAD